jgi:diphthine-ammonia ligase
LAARRLTLNKVDFSPENPFAVHGPSDRVRVAALFSGGKDSTYAAYVALQRGWDVTHLLSIFPEDRDSMLFHTPNLHLTPMQAEAMDIRFLREAAATGEDGEMDALRRILGRIDVDGVVVGAIASDYQHERVNRIADEIGIRVFAPLWRHDPRQLVQDYLAAGFHIAFSSVSAEGLDATWLGRRWDERVIEELLRLQETRGVHPCGEGGEFETLVLDGPTFTKAIEVVRATPVWRGTSGVWRVDEARLVPKSS